jgi:C4-dicarboxylate transporter
MIPIINQMEYEMRLVPTVAPMVVLAFGVALGAPFSALASDRAHSSHKHAVQMHWAASTATALAPERSVVPVAQPKETDGLSRNRDDCNEGCIDN